MTDQYATLEGSISYVRVTGEDGSVEFDAELSPGSTTRVLDAFLDPGTYRLESYQRPCDANCGFLDPPTDQCSTTFEINPERQATVRVTVTPGFGCRAVASF